MATETTVGELSINLKMKLEGLEKGLETARKKLQTLEQENRKIENSNRNLDASYLAMSATAVLAIGKIVGIIKEATEEYKAYTQAMDSLSNVADYTNQNMSDMAKIMDKYSSIMNKSDIATTIKNFSLMGFTIEQTDKMIEALTNSAIRNRNANYTVSEAVRVASEGYRQGLSTLSDSAGVTENLSVMLDNYAKSIGKTASQLTEAEKNQAYLNRTMYAAEPFAGAMENYLDSLAGKQGEYSQAIRETQVAYAEALEPMMTKMLEGGTGLLNILNSLISANPTVASGMTTFAITLTAVTVAIIAVKKAKDAYTASTFAATVATKGFTAALMSNPIFLIATGIAAIVTAYSVYCTKAQETADAQEKLNQVTEKYNQIKEGTYNYTNNSTNELEQEKQNIEKQLELKQKINELEEKIKNGSSNPLNPKFDGTKQQIDELKRLKKEYENNTKANGNFGDSVDELNSKLKINKKGIEESNASQKIRKVLEIENTKTQQKEAAQLKVNAQNMQNYLNVIKKGDKSTTEYQNAVKELTKAYPEAANAEGVIIDKAQDYINAEQAKADQAWNTSQETINGNIAVINTYIEMARAAENDTQKQTELANKIGISYQNIIPTLTSVLNILQTMGGYSPTQVPNITPTSVSRKSYGGSSSYSNKRLDNYKKEIAHKKALDQLSLQQEISMYETALRSYAKTTDEKRDLREKIYELNKELANKEKEMLEQQTEDYETYIQQQKNLRGSAYDVTEQTRDYNKIIQMHKNYLNQIMKDERLSLDERKQIYREELQTIRDYEQQKRDLRVEQIDNTVSQLTNAITKQLEEMQEKDKEFIDKQIEEVEKLKEIRINAINAEYDAKIEAINKELEALDKAEQQKSRDEEDSEYEKKKKRLEDLIDFEHDATTKVNYQKELDKLIAEYQKTLDSRALEDKKEALNAQKDLLQEEQDSKVQAVEDEVEKQKEVYDKQLTDLEEYYNKQIDMAQETAESMLLNVETNQDKILNLLKSYGNAYEITGQSLGEKLAQGINEGIASKIENIIARIQNSIDAGIEAQIAKIASSVYKYEVGSNKPQTTSVNVTQNNYIEQNPEMPSETYRKLNNVSQKLAEEFAGM
ncbi:MAG: hypothetical protein HFJ41_03980 [Clostridia bacterium]|nr:hypothetical protein [Clostridia bacterium]